MFNGYSQYEILKLNKQIKSKLFSRSITSLHDSPPADTRFSLTYFVSISDSIKRIFNKHHINISFSNNNSYKFQLQNNKIFRDVMICSGVYNLSCNCGANYVGRTLRQFKQRLSEHKHDFKYIITDESKFAAHLINNCHPFGPIDQTFSILRIITNTQKIDIWESFEIYLASYKSIIINEQLPDSNNQLFHASLKIRQT